MDYTSVFIQCQIQIRDHECCGGIHAADSMPRAFFEASIPRRQDRRRFARVPRPEEEKVIVPRCLERETGIQALERTAPTKLMIAGKPARIEFEYVGTGR